MKKLANSFRLPHVRLLALTIALFVATIVQVVNAIRVDSRPTQPAMMQRSGR